MKNIVIIEIIHNCFILNSYSKQFVYFSTIYITQMTDTASSKTFKIRRTLRLQKTQQAQQQEQVANLQDLRLKQSEYGEQKSQQITQEEVQIIQPKVYENDEEEVNCYRFPHSSFCGCQSNCLIQNFDAHQVAPGLYYGGFASGLKVRALLQLGITHILNVTCKEYTKRTKYFDYLTIDLKNNTEEDIKKFYRLTNRFIKNAVSKRGRVFIHASDLQISAMVSLGYLVGITKTPLKQSLPLVLRNKLQISPYFMKQVQSYELQKMAFVSLQRE